MIDDSWERDAWSREKLLLGCDEAGMGPLAGSLFISGVIFPRDYDFSRLQGVNDSKKLTEEKRFELESIIKSEALFWFCESAPPEVIDKGSAYHIRFELAVHRILSMSAALHQEFMVLMDGNKEIPLPDDCGIENKCLIKGDAKCFSLAAASIIAKTAKDKEMICLHEQFPAYKWKKNKGYGSREHMEAIGKYGLTPHHRRSFCKNIEVNASE